MTAEISPDMVHLRAPGPMSKQKSPVLFLEMGTGGIAIFQGKESSGAAEGGEFSGFLARKAGTAVWSTCMALGVHVSV